MRGVNKVVLVGNLGADPEVKYTQSGMAICQISLATTSVRTDKDGQKQERTEWHRVKLFGKLAEIAGEYLRKGRQCYIEGSIRYDKYTGKDNVERYSTDIIADEMQLLGGAREETGSRATAQAPAQASYPQGNTSSGRASRPPQAPPPVAASRPAHQQVPVGAGGFDEEDIPFTSRYGLF